MTRGKIRRIVASRGFGFITTEQGKDLFFHCKDVQGGKFDCLREGHEVIFEIGRRANNPVAVMIRLANPYQVYSFAEPVDRFSREPR